MLEGQQAVLGETDLMETKPHLFAIDNAAVQARRLFDKPVAAQHVEQMAFA